MKVRTAEDLWLALRCKVVDDDTLTLTRILS